MNKLAKNYKQGFTLIELLVVISIISLLSSIVLASLSDARIKARDTARIMEMKELQTALNIYFSNHGDYPAPTPSLGAENFVFYDDCGNNNYFSEKLLELTTQKLISVLPQNSNQSETICHGYNHGKNMVDILGNPTLFCGGKGIKATDYALIFSTEKPINFPKLQIKDEDLNLIPNNILSPSNDTYCLTP